MIILDASVLIAHLDGRDAFHVEASTLLATAAGRSVGASVITLAEVLVGPVRAGVLPRARRALHLLRIEAVGPAADSGERLAALRANTGLKMPDCCVLLAAEDMQADTVLTFDLRLRAAAAAVGHAVSVDG